MAARNSKAHSDAYRNRSGYPSIYLIRDGEVRAFNGVRSLDGIKHFATKGYTKVKALSTFASPFGPVGRIKGKIMSVGEHIARAYRYLTAEQGLGPVSAAVLLAVVGIGLTIAGAFFMVWLFVPSAANDPLAPNPSSPTMPAARPHAE